MLCVFIFKAYAITYVIVYDIFISLIEIKFIKRLFNNSQIEYNYNS